MKWTVQRYALREVIQTWLAVTGVLVAIVVSNQLSRVLGQAADSQYGRGVVFDLIALGSIMNLSVIVPVSLLLAVVLTLGRMYHDSEMAALQACGFGPSKLLAPLFCFAFVIAIGLAWLVFVQVPRADSQIDLLRQSALKEAQFGQLDAGRFRAFSGGDAVFYAERVDQDGVLHNIFVQRETAGKIEVALADTATYAKAAQGTHLVTLYNGRRYEGTPGHADFRVIEFREHGIPIGAPAESTAPQEASGKPTLALLGSSAPADIAAHFLGYGNVSFETGASCSTRCTTRGSRFESVRKPNFLNTFNIAVFSGNTSAISSSRPASRARTARWRIRIVPIP